jgi:hypothetical protein
MSPAPTLASEPLSPGIRKDDMVSIDSPVVSPRTYDEPIVTGKVLWSFIVSHVRRHDPQAYSILLFSVYRVLVPSVSPLMHIPQDGKVRISTHQSLLRDPLSVSRYCRGLWPCPWGRLICLDAKCVEQMRPALGSGTEAVNAIVLIGMGPVSRYITSYNLPIVHVTYFPF